MIMSRLKRILLDTNIFIIGDADKNSSESVILEALGYRNHHRTLKGEVILSDPLLDQIRRVAKYLYGKNQAGEIISNIWRYLNIYYVSSGFHWQEESKSVEQDNLIPREDVEIYLTGKFGSADYFVSGNRKLLRAIVDYECLTAEEFVIRYLSLDL